MSEPGDESSPPSDGPSDPDAAPSEEAPPEPSGGGRAVRVRHAPRVDPNRRRRRIEWLAVIGFAALAAVLLRLFVIQTYFVPSGSMVPTIQVGDRILVNKLAYHLHGVGRGDIVVFNAPEPSVAQDCNTSDRVLVKRVIGLPNETISDRNGTVYINSKVLDEGFLPQHDPGTTTGSFKPVHIGKNEYFVMGDERVDSCDSRIWGLVTRSEIIGKAEMRIWPIGHIGFF